MRWIRKAYASKNILVALYLCLLFYGIVKRNFFGVDFTDESFYIALVVHYFQGAKPFVDESALGQGAALIVYPFFKIYLILQGTHAIMLFSRIFYLGLSTIFALALAICLSRILGYKTAILIFINLILFAFSDIFTPSYYTFLQLFLTSSLFLLFYAEVYQKRFALFLSGLAAGGVLTVYPSMGLLLPVLLILVVVNFRFSRLTISYLLGLCFGIGWFILVLLKTHTLAAFFNDLRMVSSAESGEGGLYLSKILHPLPKLLRVLERFHLYVYFFLGVLLLFLCYCKRFKKAAFFKILLFSMFCILFAFGLTIIFWHPIYPKTHCFLIMLIVFSGLCLKFFLKDQMAKRLFHLVFLPSLVAGVIIIWSSNVPYLAWVVGLFPAMLVSLIYWMLWSRQVLKQHYLVFAVILLVVVNLSFLSIDWVFFYREPNLVQLNTQVLTGPYARLYTTQEKADFIEDFQNDLRPYANQGYTLFSYYNNSSFSAPYLMEGFKIDSNSVWSPSPLRAHYDEQNTLRYFQEHGYPDLAVRVQCFPSLQIDCADYPALLDQTFRGKTYEVIVQNGNYVIFKKRD